MNLTIYNPDEHEEPKGESPIPEVRKEVENIVSFSVAPPDPNYMSVEEVAAILWETPEEVMKAILKWWIPATEVASGWRIFRKLFEESKPAIAKYVKEKTEIEGFSLFPSDE